MNYHHLVVTYVRECMGVISVAFSRTPTSTNWNVHNQTCVALANPRWYVCKETRLRIGRPMVRLWLSEVHVCWFLNCILHRSSQVCSLLIVEPLWVFEDGARSLFEHVSLWCLLFGLHWTTYESNRSLFIEPSCSRPIYLVTWPQRKSCMRIEHRITFRIFTK